MSQKLVRAMRPLVEAVGRHKGHLARKMRRAPVGVPLNIAEGNEQAGVGTMPLASLAPAAGPSAGAGVLAR
jgi:hypothetical protein